MKSSTLRISNQARDKILDYAKARKISVVALVDTVADLLPAIGDKPAPAPALEAAAAPAPAPEPEKLTPVPHEVVPDPGFAVDGTPSQSEIIHAPIVGKVIQAPIIG